MKVLVIFGTRPEAVKLCPVIQCLQRDSRNFSVRVCVTAQHRHLLDQVLDAFQVRPDHDLDLMSPEQTLYSSTACIVQGLAPVLASENPDMVLVQGDTTTTFCAALAAFYGKVPVGHIEAGLRTGDILQPFPEEMNRLLTTRLASLHFAATDWAADNLRKEAVPGGAIFVTGNTGIDAVLHVAAQLEQGLLPSGPWPQLDPRKRLVLVTAHRRESFGAGMENLCTALEQLARRPDVQVAYPVHPNPNVRQTVHRRLSGNPNIILMEPLAYVPFVDLMRRSYLLLTDSGGVQEEGPSLGKPILVLREKTERPEAVLAGTVQLVGTDPERILAHASSLLNDPVLHARMSAVHNPYGDGHASERISHLIASFQRENIS